MNNYYVLRDDLYVQGRWIIDDPTDLDGNEVILGRLFDFRRCLKASIHTAGKPLDFTMSLLDIPILSPRFASAIRLLVQDHAQLIPVNIDGYDDFEILITTRLIACIDDNRSEFMKWTEKDGRPELVGHYRMVTNLILDTSKIPANLHVFRPMFWEIPLIVSQAFVDAILPLNPTGVKLKLVT